VLAEQRVRQAPIERPGKFLQRSRFFLLIVAHEVNWVVGLEVLVELLGERSEALAVHMDANPVVQAEHTANVPRILLLVGRVDDGADKAGLLQRRLAQLPLALASELQQNAIAAQSHLLPVRGRVELWVVEELQQDSAAIRSKLLRSRNDLLQCTHRLPGDGYIQRPRD